MELLLCRYIQRAFNEDTKFGVMLSVPAACLTAEEFVEHGVDFLVVGTNDLTQYTHAADRELASAEHYYRPAIPAMKKLKMCIRDRDTPRRLAVRAMFIPRERRSRIDVYKRQELSCIVYAPYRLEHLVDFRPVVSGFLPELGNLWI